VKDSTPQATIPPLENRMLQVIDILLQEVTKLIVQETKPRKIILFGSHARGTAHPDSDLDF
jgi:predicted nucleotidyltransferase